jgi:mono/diheme cytochrome c family protein
MRRSFRFWPLVPAAALALLLGALPAAWSGPEPDDSDREERLAAGRFAFRDNCLMCHSEEMTSRLRLTEKQWSAELDKMIGMGAPVPPELKPPLLEYLNSAFSGPGAAPVPPPERMTLRQALDLIRPEGPVPAGADATRGAALYAAHCATCHGPAARGGDLGTCLVEKHVLLRPTEYSGVLRTGRRRMPGFAALLKPEQEADILAWLRTLRFEGP